MHKSRPAGQVGVALAYVGVYLIQYSLFMECYGKKKHISWFEPQFQLMNEATLLKVICVRDPVCSSIMNRLTQKMLRHSFSLLYYCTCWKLTPANETCQGKAEFWLLWQVESTFFAVSLGQIHRSPQKQPAIRVSKCIKSWNKSCCLSLFNAIIV